MKAIVWSKTLGACLFGAVKLTKNSDLDKYEYSAYVLGLIHIHHCHCWLVNGLNMLFLVWTIVNQGMLMIGKKISQSLVKDQQTD